MSYRILVLDDEEPILLAMQDYFSTYGFEVDATRDLPGARSLLEKNRYSAAIVDLRLGILDHTEGLDLIRIIRERWPETRVVVLTAYGTRAIEDRAREMGIDSFLHKPQPLADVMNTVLGLLGKQS